MWAAVLGGALDPSALLWLTPLLFPFAEKPSPLPLPCGSYLDECRSQARSHDPKWEQGGNCCPCPLGSETLWEAAWQLSCHPRGEPVREQSGAEKWKERHSSKAQASLPYNRRAVKDITTFLPPACPGPGSTPHTSLGPSVTNLHEPRWGNPGFPFLLAMSIKQISAEQIEKKCGACA